MFQDRRGAHRGHQEEPESLSSPTVSKQIPRAITALGICFFKGVSLDHLHRSDRPGEPAHNSAAYHVKTPENDCREQQASISKPLTEWANEFFSTESGNLNRTLVYAEVYSDFVSDTKSSMSKRTFTESLKTYCRFAGLTYNPASITGKQADGEKFTDRVNGDGKQVVCLYIQSSDSHKTETPAQQALDQELPF